MLTTAGITRRSVGARVGRPRASADAAGGALAIGLETGGPGIGGAVKRASHHEPARPKTKTMAKSTVLRITKAPGQLPGGLAPFILCDAALRLDPGQWPPKIHSVTAMGLY
jgi:hypothetical protein